MTFPQMFYLAFPRSLIQTPSYIIWGSCEEDDWTTEVRSLLRNIKNPKVRETAIKQLKALVDMDEALS